MNGIDRYLQRKRIAQALRWIASGEHVLDVGCADGALFRQGSSLIESGVGIDTDQPLAWPAGPFEFRHGTFPEELHDGEKFDTVFMLAVVEHLSTDDRKTWATSVPEVLAPCGRLIITVPSAMVDRILDIGIRFGLLHGMDTEQHHGMDPKVIPGEFAVSRMRLLEASRFELGLNHLLVFETV